MDYGAPGGRGCYNCGDSSHQARDCPKRGTPTCYNCGEEGHAVSVQRLRRKNPATVAASPVTSLETVLTQLPPELVVVVPGNPVDTLAEVAGKNATSAARSAILLVTAPKVADPTVEVMEATKGVTEADTEVDVKAVRPAIPAVDMDTCHATAPKDRSATTAAKLVI